MRGRGWARRATGPAADYILVANGAGNARAAAATRAALDRAAASAVVSYGFCGGLAPSLGVGDIFAASCVATPARRFPASLPQTSRRFTTGTVVSVDRIAATAAQKAVLRASGADAVEMEAGGVAETAFQARLPLFCVRSITDGLGDSFALDWNAALRADGHFDTMFCLRQILIRPYAAAPEVVRLGAVVVSPREHWETSLPIADSKLAIPPMMRAAVYKGQSVVDVEEVPVPEIAPGEILVRVEACGICNTDLKKIEYNLLAPPRIFGHETAGVVVRTGGAVTKFRPGDRVIVFHHIPCMKCFYCARRLYAQCAGYKQVGVTAGYEPAGGGFAEYVRVMDGSSSVA